jgi:predicted nucleic-acid-binding protein
MIVGLDTSVVIRLLTLDPPDQASCAMDYLLERRAAGDAVHVSDWALAETYYALQYHYGVPKKAALDALRQFTASPGVTASETATMVLALPGLESARPGFIDRLIHGLYLKNGATEIATFEQSARKLPHTRVLGRSAD